MFMGVSDICMAHQFLLHPRNRDRHARRRRSFSAALQ